MPLKIYIGGLVAYAVGIFLPFLSASLGRLSRSASIMDGVGQSDVPAILVLVAAVICGVALAIKNKIFCIVAAFLAAGCTGYLINKALNAGGGIANVNLSVGAYLIAAGAIAMIVAGFMMKDKA